MSNTELRKHELTPGQVAERAGVSVSALHFYEREGLVTSVRTAGNQRRYHRDVLRRVAFVRVSQRVGISLAAIKEALESLPDGKTPTKADWARLSRRWRDDLDTRIDQLQRLRAGLDGCIGCGCLSLRTCTLNNPDDILGRAGPGPRRLLSETADEAEAVVDETRSVRSTTGGRER
jgi:MerR family redox-sensitive transcriptional activator SoxR